MTTDTIRHTMAKSDIGNAMFLRVCCPSNRMGFSYGGPRLGWLRRGYRCERDPVAHHPLGRRHMDRLTSALTFSLLRSSREGPRSPFSLLSASTKDFGRREAHERASSRDGT